MSAPRARPLRAARNAAYRIAATLTGVEGLHAKVDAVTQRVDAVTQSVDAVTRSVDALSAQIEHNHRETVEMLHLIRDAEQENRLRLWAVRETPEYAAAYEEPEPLVSVTIPTFDNTKALIERSLPSICAQTYERLEIIVVGDDAAPEVERAVRGFGDPRIRYANLTHRGPYPDVAEQRWLVAGGPPTNEATRLARGRWIAHMDDDDVSRPDRIEVLLRSAREHRYEFCYGRIRSHDPDGSSHLLCEWPPGHGKVGLQASIVHSGLRFITSELGDALFNIVGDWARVRRMLRIGVRMGMIDHVVLDYYPGWSWHRAGIEPPAPSAITPAG